MAQDYGNMLFTSYEKAISNQFGNQQNGYNTQPVQQNDESIFNYNNNTAPNANNQNISQQQRDEYMFEMGYNLALSQSLTNNNQAEDSGEPKPLSLSDGKLEAGATQALAEQDAKEYGENFDAFAVADSMHESLKSNPDVIRKYLSDGDDKLNEAEIRAVALAYQNTYGTSLIDDVKTNFDSDEEVIHIGTIQGALNLNDKVDNLNTDERKEYIKNLAEDFHQATTGDNLDAAKAWEIMQLDEDVLEEVIDFYDNSAYSDNGDFVTSLEKSLGQVDADENEDLPNDNEATYI